jgi:glycerol kinase
MIIGVTRATAKHHIIRATLESMAYQTADVIDLMEKSVGVKLKELAVDGGASANDLLLSFQSDILGVPVERPSCIESTALGAAYLAGLSTGFYNSLDEIRANRQTEKIFEPKEDASWRESKMTRWRRAVERCLDWEI